MEMKLNYDKEQFSDKLKKAIYEAGINSRIQEEITDKIAKRGYRRGFISGVFEGNVILSDELSLTDLGVFALEIYNATDIKYINPNIYLEEIEMERVINHKVTIEQDVFEYPVVFEDVRYVSSDMCTVVLSSQFIAKLGRSNMLNYEFETQRDAKIIETERGIIQTPNINPQSIIEITEELITDDFIPNTLTFNMPLRNSDNFKYDIKNKKWILLKGKLNIIDGYHRYRGIIAALGKKNINYNFEVRLANFDEDKARKFIVQEDKRNPILKEYIKSIDNADLITQIINQLNQNNRSELKGKITTDRATIQSGYALVSFETMYKTIEKLWKPITIDEVDELFEYLRMYFNKLVNIYKEELKVNIGVKNIINDERMFVIYLIIAKKIQFKDNWREELERAMSKLELSNNLVEEYLKVTPSEMLRRFNRHYSIAENIVEVITNDR